MGGGPGDLFTQQVINEAFDAGTAVVGGLCVLFYLLLGAGALLNDKAEKRRAHRLYGPRKPTEKEETEDE